MFEHCGLNFVIYIRQNITYIASENFTKVIESDGAYGLVVFQAVKQTAAYIIVFYKLISCYSFLF